MRTVQPQPRRVIQSSLLLPPDVRFAGGAERQVAVSPDGTRLVYAASDQLYLRDMAQVAFMPVRGTDGARGPVFSPDGQWIAFWAAGELKKVSVTGGAPVTLAQIPQLSSKSWGADDTIFTDLVGIGIAHVPGDGGTPEVVIPLEPGQVDLPGPQLLPGGEWVLFVVLPNRQAVIQSLITGERRMLLENVDNVRYLPTGHLAYVLDGTLLAVPFDAEQQTVTGGPVSLVEGIDQGLNGLAQFDVASDGSLAYLPARSTVRTLAWVDRDGQMTPLSQGNSRFEHPRLSPDDRQVAVSISGESWDIWLYDIERDAMTRLTRTQDGRSARFPTWTPDGSSVTFGIYELGLYQQAADGSGDVETVLETFTTLTPGSWSPDSTTLVFYESTFTGTSRDIWTLGPDGEASSFLATEFNERAPRLSPDGRWLTYVSNQSGEDRIYVQPFPDGGAVTPISTGVGTEPVWSRDGTELFFRDGDRMMAVDVEAGTAFTAGTPQVLFEDSYQRGGVGNAFYDVAFDGRFLMSKADAPAVPQVNVVQNWFEDLKVRVPVD